jgi:hypothetical protein
MLYGQAFCSVNAKLFVSVASHIAAHNDACINLRNLASCLIRFTDHSTLLDQVIRDNTTHTHSSCCCLWKAVILHRSRAWRDNRLLKDERYTQLWPARPRALLHAGRHTTHAIWYIINISTGIFTANTL